MHVNLKVLLPYWREDNPGQPDPDDLALRRWLVKTIKAEWREAHPGEPLPEYATVRQWALDTLERQFAHSLH
jgi:hypothetical protein